MVDEPCARRDGEKRELAEGSSLESWVKGTLSDSSRDAAQLIEAHRKYLLLVANRELDPRLRGKVAPSDVVQETFVQAQEKFATFRGSSEEELQAWLRRILLNQLVDARRRYVGSNKRRLAREVPTASDSRIGRHAIDLASTDATPRTDAIAREEAAALQKAVTRLSEDYRQVIMLRSWERLEFDEVGRRMERSAEAARKLWARAVERLQEELGNLDGD